MNGSSTIGTVPNQSPSRNEIKEMLLESGGIVREQVKRLHDLQTSAFQLSNYYFVFQGVILAVLSNGSTSLRCNDSWFLATISGLAALLNLCALFIIGCKYIKMRSELDESWREYNRLYTNLNQNGAYRPKLKCHNDDFTEVMRFFVLGFCMVVFLAFTIVTLYGCLKIFCREDECNNNFIDKDKCVKLCDGGKCVNLCTRC